MLNRSWFQLITLTSLIGLDRWSKEWIVQHLPLGKTYVINSILQWVHVRNKGISFGLLARQAYGERLLVLGLILLGLCWILYLYKTAPPTGRIRYALILILGGALGNIIDRILYGAVVDFIHLHAYGYAWPVFNCADAYLTLGFCLVVLSFPRKA